MADQGVAALGMPQAADPTVPPRLDPPAPARSRREPWGLGLILAFVAMATIAFNTTQVAGWPLSDVVFVGAAGAVVASILMGSKRYVASATMRRASPQYVVGGLILLSAGVLSSMWVEDPAASLTIVLRFAWPTLVWSWIFRALVVNRLALDRLVNAYRIAMLIGATAATAGYVGLVQLGESDSGRQMAFTNHPNNLGGMLAIGLPFLLLDVQTSDPQADERQRARTLVSRLLLTGFVVFAISTTGSMSSLLAAVCGLATIGAAQVVARGKPLRRYAPLTAIAVTSVALVAVAALAASGAPVVERLIGYSQGDARVATSVDSRGEQDSFVIDRLDQYLVVGVGFAQADNDVREETGHGIHNNVLKLVYEAGVPAVVGLFVLLLVVARQGWRLLMNTRGTRLHGLVTALMASFATGLLFAQFHPIAYERYYWFPVALITAVWSLRRHELRSQSQPSTGSPPLINTTG
jgi:hypothetical protein